MAERDGRARTRICLASWLALFALPMSGCDAPSGEHGAPFAVGSRSLFIHDESRPYDSVGGADEGVRILLTEIWYPVERAVADSGRYRRATYGDYVFGDRSVHRLMMTRTTFFHLTPQTVRTGVTGEEIEAAIEELFSRPRGSFVDAPAVHAEGGWPVIVMTHGDAGSRYNMETVCEFLAAHGYVVLAPEHTGNSPYAQTGRDPALAAEGGDPRLRERMASVLPRLSEHGTWGDEAHYGQTYAPSGSGRDGADYLRRLDAALLQRLGDLRAALAELDRMNAEGFAGAPPGWLDLERVGLMGRSFGGSTTLLGLAMEPRFAAGFAVVPPGWADQRAALPREALEPEGTESVLLAAGGPFPLTRLSKPALLLSGAEDELIIGLSARLAGAGAGPAPTRANPHPTLRRAFEASEAPVAWALLADANHATLGVSGGYWWPDLKPDSQSRYFEPDVEFRLTEPRVAHRVQQELALAFFDVTIRGRRQALSTLSKNPWADAGLVLEIRNF